MKYYIVTVQVLENGTDIHEEDATFRADDFNHAEKRGLQWIKDNAFWGQGIEGTEYYEYRVSKIELS